MTLDVSIQAAFLAGIVSFLSPCVLPLVPPYMVYITGASLDELSGKSVAGMQSRALLAALMFVLGFSAIFIALGATASVIAAVLRQHLALLAQIAGIAIIIMGLHFLGVFKFALLNREARYQHARRPVGLLGAFTIGMAFAFGWTPCIGPVLAAILTIAASQQDVAKGAGLLAVYSAGLGIPFLAAAASLGAFMTFFTRFKSYLRRVEQVMGALLVVTGIMFLSGTMQAMSYWLIEKFPVLGTIG
jgi:cytochrome c-type biogenesis protein